MPPQSLLLVLLLSSSLLQAQTSAPPPLQIPRMAGTGVVFGTVVAETTGRPIKGATVTALVVASGATFVRTTTTDRLGKFLVGNLTSGQVRVSASAPGYLVRSVGQSGADDNQGTFIPLVDGQITGPLTLQLQRAGVIAGTILDDAGEPLGGVAVQAFRRSFENGRRQYLSAGSSTTDDRGAYRIANLIPGRYLVGVVPRTADMDATAMERIGQSGGAGTDAVAAMVGVSLRASQDAGSPMYMSGGQNQTSIRIVSSGSPLAATSREGKLRTYVPTFFPGTPAAQASAILLGPGQETPNIVFQLSAAEMSSIAGRVVGPDGTPPQTALTLTVQGDDAAPVVDSLTALVGDSGAFSLVGVPVGSYNIEARSTSAASGTNAANAPHRLWARVPVNVDNPGPSTVVVALHPALSVSGAVHYDGTTPAPTAAALAQTRVQLIGPPGLPSLVSSSVTGVALDANGRFAFPASIIPGDYRVTVSNGLPGAWSFSSISVNGRESLDNLLHLEENVENVVITMSDRVTEVSGIVSGPTGLPNLAATVIVFPQDSRLWIPYARQLKAARPLSNGRYVVKDLPPGDYLAAAAVDVERGQWFDPEFLTALQRSATRLTLGIGETRTLNLKSVK
jgi:hypothetical protein